MIHDFEEIVMVYAWQQKNKQYIQSRKDKYIPFKFKASTSAFSIAVAEEFVIISIVTIISCLLNNYVIWFGLFIAFIIHFFLHIFMCISFKKYVPGVATSIVFIPLCCFMVYMINISMHYSITTLSLSILISVLIFYVNIYILHKAIEKFSYWLEKYSISSI